MIIPERALTVRQPWAWAIFHGKDVENRTTLWNHRGPLAIHAGAGWSDRGEHSPLVREAAFKARCRALDRGLLQDVVRDPFHRSAIIGVVNVLDIHHAEPDCCDSEWAEDTYTQADGTKRTRLTHLVLADAVELRQPVPCSGRLGLWRLPEDIAAQLQEAYA